jgi:predicted amidohydrolase
VQRKLHPAINHSVYDAGERADVFTVGELTFGILICNDSNFPDVARTMVSRGAGVLFVPTNNGLPLARDQAGVAVDARRVDVGRAIESGVAVIRADVAGRTADLMCVGSSAIVDRDGRVLQAAAPFSVGLLVAEIDTPSRRPSRC